MAHYYDISLKNTRRYEAHDVRLNGLPLASLNMMRGPGRLEFVARPAVTTGAGPGAGSFKSMSGLDVEVEIADYGVPKRRCTLKGRVTSAIARRGTGPTNQIHEEVTFVYHHITW